MRFIKHVYYKHKFFCTEDKTASLSRLSARISAPKIFSLTVKRATDNCQKMVQLPQDLLSLLRGLP